jgi:hypothetical protein
MVGQQPPPLNFKDSTKLQPIVENENSPKSDRYIQTVKLYYKDLHYCSDSTKISFLTQAGDSLSKYNVKQSPSCTIVVRFNLTNEELKWLERYPVTQIGIYNRVTDNYYLKKVEDPNYFIKVLKPYSR